MRKELDNELSVLMFDAAYPPPVVGGKEKQAHLLSMALLRKGVRVQALSYLHGVNASGMHDGVYVQRVPKGSLAALKMFYALVKLRKSFAILHIHTPSRIGKVAALAGWLLRYRVVFKFPGMHLLDRRDFSSRLFWFVLPFVVSLFVVLENDTRNKLSSKGVAGRKVFSAKNGVEMGGAVAVRPSRPEVKLLFVGRLVAVKACDQLIRACALLRDAGQRFSLRIVGDGPLEAELSALVRELDLSGVITFEGYHPKPIEWMKVSDILILPSLHEGMSNVLLEAISIGLPIVASDVGAARKLVGFFGERFLCKAADPACLAEKIQSLSNDPQLRVRYGAELYRRGRERFSIDTVATEYIEEYRRLLRL